MPRRTVELVEWRWLGEEGKSGRGARLWPARPALPEHTHLPRARREEALLWPFPRTRGRQVAGGRCCGPG
eukprot:3010882-Alexandrium_andersonii.AAC.1